MLQNSLSLTWTWESNSALHSKWAKLINWWITLAVSDSDWEVMYLNSNSAVKHHALNCRALTSSRQYKGHWISLFRDLTVHILPPSCSKCSAAQCLLIANLAQQRKQDKLTYQQLILAASEFDSWELADQTMIRKCLLIILKKFYYPSYFPSFCQVQVKLSTSPNFLPSQVLSICIRHCMARNLKLGNILKCFRRKPIVEEIYAELKLLCSANLHSWLKPWYLVW